jgi:RNA-directed DNA polymerase
MIKSDLSNLTMHGLPVMHGLSDLSERIRVSEKRLFQFANFTERYYRLVKIEKPCGGVRSLAIPNRELKATQSWILGRILNPLHVSPACKGFAIGESTRDNALPHSRANAILSLDIKDFFSSVRVGSVYRIYRQIGYSENIAWFLTAICTVFGSLPQGAPSS